MALPWPSPRVYTRDERTLLLMRYSMKLFSGISALIVLGVSQSAMAADFSYTSLDARYISADIKLLNTDFSFDGFGFGGRYQMGRSSYIFGRVESLESSDLNFNPSSDAIEIGVGGFTPITRSADLFFGVGYSQYDIEFGSLSSQSLDGFSLRGGVRVAVSPVVEVEALLNNLHLDGQTDTLASFIGRYHLTQSFVPEVRVAKSDDSEIIALGFQFKL